MWQYCVSEKESEEESWKSKAGFVAQKQSSMLTEDPGSISTFKRK